MKKINGIDKILGLAEEKVSELKSRSIELTWKRNKEGEENTRTMLRESRCNEYVLQVLKGKEKENGGRNSIWKVSC